MIAFDTDVLTELLLRNPSMIQRANLIPVADQCLPIVVVEETLRGRLDGIRRSQAKRSRISIDRAYSLFQDALEDIQRFRILRLTPTAERLFQSWRAARIRVGTQDLRIAAICCDHGATLATRNARDYTLIPGLTLELWN